MGSPIKQVKIKRRCAEDPPVEPPEIHEELDSDLTKGPAMYLERHESPLSNLTKMTFLVQLFVICLHSPLSMSHDLHESKQTVQSSGDADVDSAVTESTFRVIEISTPDHVYTTIFRRGPGTKLTSASYSSDSKPRVKLPPLLNKKHSSCPITGHFWSSGRPAAPSPDGVGTGGKPPVP